MKNVQEKMENVVISVASGLLLALTIPFILFLLGLTLAIKVILA